jgi:uncharacterized protein YdhG (YjbR/CyaY superfamily)
MLKLFRFEKNKKNQMKTSTAPAKNVDEYLAMFPASVQKTLEQLRKTIKAAAPKADEVISYQMPAFKYLGMLVYFAGYKNHIGFYPVSSAIKAFEKELSKYETSKGTVKFPIDKSLPLGLISKMVKFRVKENEMKQKLKK